MIAIMSVTVFDRLRAISSSSRDYAEGDTIFRTGDAVTYLHVVAEGRAHLIRHLEGGKTLILQRAGAPAILAEASLHNDVYHCDAVAETRLKLVLIERRVLARRLAHDRDLALAVEVYLAREVQQARLRAEILSMKTIAHRLDAWLACHESGMPPKGGWKLLAAEIAVTPEALYREIARRRVSPGRAGAVAGVSGS
jgi:CRP-like cAMP-binding protein